MKTLVVGLGSTGTKICENLVQRINDELGALSRAPWVEFLCIETDSAQASVFNGTDNFRTLSIRPEQYSDIVNHPQNYNQSIALERWADMETLAQLPGKAVDQGAGHIRMVGRLALLYPDNYINIKNALDTRLSNLRGLSAAHATEAVNENAVGHANEIVFAGNMIRIIVVGTLVGGTCSGTVADFGIILETLKEPGERTMGMFTIPHPQYGIANHPKAELHKVNAYHAIQELNQYLNFTDRDRYKNIKYADKSFDMPVLQADQTPYDLVYLVRPRDNVKDDENKLNGAVADRIFLNIFVPDSDPFKAAVNNAPIPPKDGRAFAFATFGLSTIEYPVRRIIEACKLKTLRHAFMKWKDRVLEKKLEDELDDLGLTDTNLVDKLLTDDGGAPIRNRIDSKAREVRDNARRGNIEAARKALDELRTAFERDKGDSFRGIVPRTIERNRTRAAHAISSEMNGRIRRGLLDYDEGVNPLLEIFTKVRERTSALRSWDPGDVNTGVANAQLDKIEGVAKNALVGLFLLRSKAINRMLQPLDKALRNETEGRLERLAKGAMIDQGGGQRTERGTLSLIEIEANVIQKRLQNLKMRLDSQVARWGTAINDLEGQNKDINGLSLFEKAPNGTVHKEFQRLMPDGEIEQRCAQIIASWTELLDGALPGENQPDWLSQSVNLSQPPFSASQLHSLEQMAVVPFQPLADPNTKDVATRLFEAESPNFNPGQEAMAAAELARIFLPIQENLGQPDPQSPLPRQKLLLGSALSPRLESSLQNWRSTYPAAAQSTIKSPFRIVMLEEAHKFSLRGSLDVTQSLAAAKSELYKTFFTRKRSDIDWTPISDSEVKHLRNAEELVIFGIIHGVLRPQGGKLMMEWPDGVGEPTDPARRARRLPMNIGKTARLLAFASRTEEGQSLNNALTTLNSRIQNHYRQEFVQKHPRLQDANEAYVRFLHHQIRAGEGPALESWDHSKVTRMVLSHCRKYPDLIRALFRVFQPEPAHLQRLYRKSGERRPKGNGFFDKDGYYCTCCGALIGYSEEVAIDNALQCDYYPDDPLHPFGETYDPFQSTARN
jgi:hypothetical protein